jgi:catechol 2,3-dioxygenase-like lactoylglutathione lyase family enzyme
MGTFTIIPWNDKIYITKRAAIRIEGQTRTVRSHIDRRTFLWSLPAAAVAPRLLGEPLRGMAIGARHAAVRGVALNHVELAVADPARTIEFYQGLFGLPTQARRGGTTDLRIGDGPQFMAVRAVRAGESPSLSRLGIAVGGFDIDGTTAALEASGLTSAGEGVPEDRAMRVWTVTRPTAGGDGPTRELFAGDPNALVFQVVDRSHCGGGGALGTRCGIVEPSPTPGLFALRDLSHFTCRVTDAQSSQDFFQNVFGLSVQVYQATTPALGFGGGPQFLMFIGGGPAATQSGRPRGAIDHVCFSLDGFDTDEVLETLAGYGIRPQAQGEARNTPLRSFVSMRMPNRGGAEGGTPELYFVDPDGLILQLQDTSYCGGGGVLGDLC